MIKINTEPGKKIYFASDQHLGAPSIKVSFPREQKFIRWLNQVKEDATAIFLLGDLFDFWFEYKTVVPKGFVRVLGKLAEIRDSGVSIYFFVGNHDLWMRDYLETELNIPIYREPKQFLLNGKKFLIGHGDGLGPGDKGYKLMKKIFTFKPFQWIFRWLHPDLGLKLGQYLSVKNKLISGDDDVLFLGEEKEFLIIYCKEKLAQKHYDYFVFGHRHLPIEHQLSKDSTYINIGDWVHYYTYGFFEDTKLSIREFEKK